MISVAAKVQKIAMKTADESESQMMDPESEIFIALCPDLSCSPRTLPVTQLQTGEERILTGVQLGTMEVRQAQVKNCFYQGQIFVTL